MINFGDKEYEYDEAVERFVPVNATRNFGIRIINKQGSAPRVYLPKLMLSFLSLDRLDRVIYINDKTITKEPTPGALPKTVVMPASQKTGYILIPTALIMQYETATHIQFTGHEEEGKRSVTMTFLRDTLA